jgi:hypothetical protein
MRSPIEGIILFAVDSCRQLTHFHFWREDEILTSKYNIAQAEHTVDSTYSSFMYK